MMAGPMSSQPFSIAVYCGSSTTTPTAYFDLAYRIGQAMAQRHYGLVWGGGHVGMMGRVADGCRDSGGRVVGVIPQFMVDLELAYIQADQLIVTDDMRQRKAEMEKRADGFLVLPGGIGTLEEMFEILTLRVLEQHVKPMVLLNHQGFYDSLLALFDRMLQERFLRPATLKHYELAGDVKQAMDMMDRLLKRDQ